MKKINAVLLIVGLLVSTSAGAVEVRGGVSCGVWISDKGIYQEVNKLWLVGLLSGFALYSDKDVLKGTDSRSIYLWMDNYCKANPLKNVNDGGGDLFFELKKQKGL